MSFLIRLIRSSSYLAFAFFSTAYLLFILTCVALPFESKANIVTDSARETEFPKPGELPVDAALDSHSDNDEIGYDAIVDDLTKQNRNVLQTKLHKRAQSNGSDALSALWMHGGVGYALMTENLQLPTGKSFNYNQNGFQASLGIDILSPKWMAEGTARNFGIGDNHGTSVSLQEFELKGYYKSHLTAAVAMRIGAGVNARYLEVKQPASEGGHTTKYSTPALVGTLGTDYFISKLMSFGADLSTRASLISDTIDHGSFDLTFRLDTHF